MARSDVKAKRSSPGPRSAHLPPSKYFVAVRDTLSEKVYKAFKRDIIRGVYQPGEPLTEKEKALEGVGGSYVRCDVCVQVVRDDSDAERDTA